MKKRILSVLLVLCMLLTVMPTVAFSEESSTQANADDVYLVNDYSTSCSGHNWVRTGNQHNATCISQSYEDVECSECGATGRIGTGTPLLGHTNLKHCTRCGRKNLVQVLDFWLSCDTELEEGVDYSALGTTTIEISASSKVITFSNVNADVRTSKKIQISNANNISSAEFVFAGLYIWGTDGYYWAVNIENIDNVKFDITVKMAKDTINLFQSHESSIGRGAPGIGTAYENVSLTLEGEGEVIAAGAKGCAGIGTKSSLDSDTKMNITINNCKVTAIGGEYGAGIGSGMQETVGDIKIVDSIVYARGGWLASGIGSGYSGFCNDITIENSTVTGYTLTDNGYDLDAPAGSVCGIGGQTGNITITDSTINAESACGIGIKNADSSKIVIKDSDVNSRGRLWESIRSSDVTISGGFIRCCSEKAGAFYSEPKISNMDVAAGKTGEEVEIKNPTLSDYQKQSVIMAKKGELYVTVTFENAIMSGLNVNETPEPVTFIRGRCLSSLPVVYDLNENYYFSGWTYYYESYEYYWSLDTPVNEDVTLHSDWYSYSVGFYDQSNNWLSGIEISETYGATSHNSVQVKVKNNGTTPVEYEVECDCDALDIIYFSDTVIDGYDQRAFYVSVKNDANAGEYAGNITVKIKSTNDDGYSTEKIIPFKVTIEKATPELRGAPYARLTYGQKLSEAEMQNAKAVLCGYSGSAQYLIKDNVAGEFKFVSSETVPSVGDKQEYDVVFIPGDTKNYNSFTCEGYAYVSKAVIRDLPAPTVDDEIDYGTPLSEIALPEGWKWLDETIVPTPNSSDYKAYFEIDDMSNYDISGTQTSDWLDDYTKYVQKVALKVNKAVPYIQESPMASAIKEGQTLSESVLSGGKAINLQNNSTVEGNFVWEDLQATVSSGTQKYKVIFIPNETDLYETVTDSVSVMAFSIHTITFDPDNGTEPYTQDVAEGGYADEPKDITKQGYTLEGWYDNSTKWDFGKNTVDSSVTLKAKWLENSNYVITFDVAGGSTITPKTNVKWTDKVLDGVTEPINPGFVFNGWKYGNEKVTSDTTYASLAKNDGTTSICLTAQWKQGPANTLRLNGNGGLRNNSSTYSVYTGADYYTMFTSDAYGFVLEGYGFAGWNTKPDGSGTYVAKGDDVRFNIAHNGEIVILYAQWKDITAPTGEIKLGTNSWEIFFNNITFDLFFKDAQEVEITAADNGGDDVAIEYMLSGEELTGNDLATATFTAYNGKFSVEPNNEYVIYAKLTDKTGNVTYINSDGIVLDSIKPVISGIENGKIYCKAQTVTVSDNYEVAVTVNGNPVTLASGQFTLSPAAGEQKIVVTDKAGNQTELTVIVNDGHIGGTANCMHRAVCDICGEEYGEVNAENHTALKHIEAKAATTESEGNIEYWYCESCNKYFSDKDGKNEIKLADTIIAKLPKTDNNDKAPQTGGNSHMAFWLALFFASGGALIGTAAYGKKKKYSVK